MENLRDQLLKAGVITKKQKRQTEQEKRRERKQHNKGHLDDVIQAQQRQAYEAKLEAQRAADQRRAAAQRAQQEAREKRLQVRHIIDYWKVPEEPAGSRRWYFTTRHNTIQYLYVTEPLAMQLDTGALAIIERPDEADVSYALVDHEAAALIASIDPQWVRFYSDEPTDE
jgi:uncharacterized protein YaiL (DUF2058 family)